VLKDCKQGKDILSGRIVLLDEALQMKARETLVVELL
jgi:hypothetical protein